jgi:triacylglycerol lipase
MAPAWEWDPWISRFETAGLPHDWIEIFDTDRCEHNTVLGAQLGTWVDELLARTGADKVDLIAHSMGALAARWCIVRGSCHDKVANVVTLSGANHGTVWAAFCGVVFWSKGCPDMAPDSPMLTQLNAGDETPDGIRWQAWVSICEIAILPQTSALLDGAENHYLTECVAHASWKWYRPTIDAVVADRSRSPSPSP